MIHIFMAEDSLEGILSAVSAAYKSRYGHADNRIHISGELETMELFSEYIPVETDQEAAEKVYHAVYEKIGSEALKVIESTASSRYPERAEVIYRFLILGFANGERAIDYLTDPNIIRIREIYRNVGNEVCHWQEFLRFKVHQTGKMAKESVFQEEPEQGKLIPVQTEDGNRHELLTAVIAPKNKILTSIMPHFSDRFSSENFIIYDETYDMAGIHEKHAEWFAMAAFSEAYPEILLFIKKSDSSEKQMQELWKIFFQATDIKERSNIKLQKQLLPGWFRKNMTEFIS